MLQIDIDNDKINDLLIYSGSVLTALSGLDGARLWRVDAAARWVGTGYRIF